MTNKTLFVALVGAGLVPGCAGENFDIGAAEMAERGGPYEIGVFDDIVDVDYQDESVENNQCLRIAGDVTATLGGVPMTIDRGGEHDTDTAMECSEPSFRLTEPPAVESAKLVFADSETSISCDLGNSLAKRSVALMSTPAWTFAPGQSVTVKWSPPRPYVSDNLVVELSGAPGVHIPAQMDTTTGALSFVVPADASAGAQKLSIEETAGGAGLEDLICPELGRVKLDMQWSVHQDVTIAP